LYRNAYALTLSSTLTAAVGVAYWILAARRYPSNVVGLNSAAISAMMFLAGAAQLNLTSALLRFIPEAGRATARFVGRAYLVAAGVALVVCLIFIRGIGTWAPALAFLGSSPLFIGWFTAAALGWCVFVLQDSVLTGLGQAMVVPIENAAFSVLKLALLLGFAVWFPLYGVLASWTTAMAVTLLPVNILIFRRLIPRHVAATRDRAVRLDPSRVVRYVAGDYVGALCWLAATTLLPVMVTVQAGATDNAYFYLSWQIALVLYFVSPNMGSSLIVAVANDPPKLATYSYQAFLQTARIVVPLATLMTLGAPFVLRIFGSSYAAHGTMVLRLLALSSIPHIVNSLYVSIARAQRRVGAVVMVLAPLCACVLILSYLLLQRYGITGVGVAWLVSQTAMALILLQLQLRPLWSSRLAGSHRIDAGRTRAMASALPALADGRAPVGSAAAAPSAPLDGARQSPLALIRDRAAGDVTVAGGRRGRTARDWVMRGVYATAVALRLLSLLQRTREYPRARQRLAGARGVLPDIMPAIMPLPDVPPAVTWIIHRVLPSASDMTVLTLGPDGYAPVALLKLPRTIAAVRSLEQQERVLARLHTVDRLSEWRRLLPRVLARGELRGQAYMVEQMLPGQDARSLLSRPATRMRVEAAAATAIGELHRCTAVRAVVEGALLNDLIDEPLRIMRSAVAMLPRAVRYDEAIERLAAELRGAFVGRTLSLSTVHGDFFPGNILVTPDGAMVTGIIDWDHATADGLPVLDLLLLLLSTRMLVQHRDLGDVVWSSLDGADWTQHERELLDSVWATLPGDAIELRAMILLCWVKHVAANLTKSTWYAGHRLWVANTIERVLQRL
jgi:aminoglycoside phosphotransferase (APT) family kinase protein/O-antigen/teichoic acid export membrane protein